MSNKATIVQLSYIEHTLREAGLGVGKSKLEKWMAEAELQPMGYAPYGLNLQPFYWADVANAFIKGKLELHGKNQAAQLNIPAVESIASAETRDKIDTLSKQVEALTALVGKLAK
jgi:hypothetical protein